MLEAIPEFLPGAKWQRCVTHFHRNVFTSVPKGRRKEVAAALKAIRASEDRTARRNTMASPLEPSPPSRLKTTPSTSVRKTLDATPSHHSCHAALKNQPSARASPLCSTVSGTTGSEMISRTRMASLALSIGKVRSTQPSTESGSWYLSLSMMMRPSSGVLRRPIGPDRIR
ncbi:transposase [Candidatus Sumerlaeota bacterium]|nr:transposase [Candidatus Sumerlaeota bacterium]